ncbi:MAG: hypothetical protein JOZ49_11510 [Mycolicibacterium sp.]|nr:hypothetical protein [Mycolicibacterium sp.]
MIKFVAKLALAVMAAASVQAFLPAPARADEFCGHGVYAMGPTTCQFALSVADAWANSPGNQVRAWSEATGQDYVMDCAAVRDGEVCRGGNNASVVILP